MSFDQATSIIKGCLVINSLVYWFNGKRMVCRLNELLIVFPEIVHTIRVISELIGNLIKETLRQKHDKLTFWIL